MAYLQMMGVRAVDRDTDCTDVGSAAAAAGLRSKALNLLVNLSFDTRPCYKLWSHKSGITATWYRDELYLEGGWRLFLGLSEEFRRSSVLSLRHRHNETSQLRWFGSPGPPPLNSVPVMTYWEGIAGQTSEPLVWLYLPAGPRALWDHTNWSMSLRKGCQSCSVCPAHATLDRWTDGSSAILHSCCIYSSLEKHNANNYYSSTVFTQKVNVSSLYFSPSGVFGTLHLSLRSYPQACCGNKVQIRHYKQSTVKTTSVKSTVLK